jgi:hypothetical protein
MSRSNRLRSGKQLVVSSVNVLAPYLFGGEFELAIRMYAWQRVGIDRIYNVVSTFLEPLCTPSVNNQALHSTTTYAVTLNPRAMELDDRFLTF